MRYYVFSRGEIIYKSNFFLNCSYPTWDEYRNIWCYPMKKDFLIPFIYQELFNEKPISCCLVEIETVQKDGDISLGQSDEEKLIALCLPDWYNVYLNGELWSKQVKRKINKETGEIKEEFENPIEEALSNHWDFAVAVNFLVEHKSEKITYGATPEELGVSHEVYDEAVKRILGKTTYKDKTWREFLK